MYQSMTSNPRKRPAPGTSPSLSMAPMQQQRFPSPTNNDLMRWHDGSDASGFVGGGNSQGVNPYCMVPAQQQPQYGQVASPNPNNTLARRQMNRALVPTAPRGSVDPSNDPWTSYLGDESALMQQQPNGAAMAENDSIEALEEAAQKAKREAQAKRKQIPPFVQKLSSFLDEKRNVDLIRWSENGDSFIVLDEDEFAKTLIPELFKHNNYASFVRQLNMYGFHKRVGLSDNSMRASERKNKSPSEYSNPYFRRGHPNLLWLINKPKSGGKPKVKSGSKQSAEGDVVDSDDEVVAVEEPSAAPERERILHTGNQNQRALPSAGDMPLQQKEMAVIREELAKVRSQQKMILEAINQIQRNNSTLYQQAAIFQEQHDRHQNSINAILNFLANVFRKTLEDQSGPQNVNELLANIIPGNGGGAMHQGSVVDLGDFVQGQASSSNPVNTPKRARGLLPPIPGPNQGRASTTGSTPSASETTPQPFNNHNEYQSGTVTELYDSPENNPSPDYLAQELKSKPHESMMKIIQDTNANSSAGLDLPEVVANTPATMTNDQRQQMLNNMLAQTNAPASGSIPASANQKPTTPPFPTASPGAAAAGGGNGPAGDPSSSTNHANLPDHFSLSPVVGSAPQPPNINHINYNNAEIDALRRMSQDNSDKINHLQSMLGPLSPSGRIPDFDDPDVPGGANYFGGSPGGSVAGGGISGGSGGGFDIDNFINEDAFGNNSSAGDFAGMDFGGAGNDFDFSLLNDGAGDSTGGGTGVGSGVINTPSPAGTEEIQRDEFGGVEASPRDSKRRRVG